jgi:hypothetical protein
MSTNPLRREGGYWKPVLDYDSWDDPKTGAGSESTSTGAHEVAIPSKATGHFLDFSRLCARLGLSKAAMVCLIVGLMCIGAAITIGFIYTAGTLVDWQAIQIWRSEWLIAAGVAFVCGILLNSRTKSDA